MKGQPSDPDNTPLNGLSAALQKAARRRSEDETSGANAPEASEDAEPEIVEAETSGARASDDAEPEIVEPEASGARASEDAEPEILGPEDED